MRKFFKADTIITVTVRVLFLVEFLIPVGIWLLRRDATNIINMFTATLGFSLTFIPSVVDRISHHRLKLSSALSCAIVLFIFGAEFLGEIKNFYYIFPWWDVVLHTISGVILGMIGFMLVHSLNESVHARVSLSPFFVCFFAFCFALAAGVLWEIFEFMGDRLFGLNMQKYMPPTGTTQLITAVWRYDAGLIDTMKDIICDALSALATSIVGYISLKIREYDKTEKPTEDDGWSSCD